MTAIYDQVRDRMVIFGGSTSDDYYGVHNDVWELDMTGTPTWHHLAPSGPSPIARRSGTAIYDPLRDRMVLYGGWDSTENGTYSFLGDTWALSFPGNQWTQLVPAGTTPAGRDVPAAAIYDRRAQRHRVSDLGRGRHGGVRHCELAGRSGRRASSVERRERDRDPRGGLSSRFRDRVDQHRHRRGRRLGCGDVRRSFGRDRRPVRVPTPGLLAARRGIGRRSLGRRSGGRRG